MSKISTVAIIGGEVSGLSAGGLLSRMSLKVELLRKITANQMAKLPDGSIVTFVDGLDVMVNGRKGDSRNPQLPKELVGMLKKWGPVLSLFAEDILLHPFSLLRLIAKGGVICQTPRVSCLGDELPLMRLGSSCRNVRSNVLCWDAASRNAGPIDREGQIVEDECQGLVLILPAIIAALISSSSVLT